MSTAVAVTGDDRERAVAAAEDAGLRVVRRDPELVLCHGGDGTLLRAERLFPEVPKVPVRVARVARHCERHDLDTVLSHLVAGRLERESLELLALSIGRWEARALNDVVLRNDDPGTALRFRIGVDGLAADELTGDGVVIATPFGSTAYYRSITRDSFTRGLGVAFLNLTAPRSPLLLPEPRPVTVEVVRGPAVLVRDNDPRAVLCREGHRFVVAPAAARATVLGLDALRCQRCRRHDAATFNPH